MFVDLSPPTPRKARRDCSTNQDVESPISVLLRSSPCLRSSVLILFRSPRHLRARTPDVIHQAYSCLSATIGSIRVARRAGSQHATNATATSSAATPANVIGSVAFTPNSRCSMTRVNPNAATSPIVKPMNGSFIPSTSTSRRRVASLAPSAMRTPNSWVRCATAKCRMP